MLIYFPGDMLTELLATMAHEYIPFVVLIFALYTTAGGIHVTKKVALTGSPLQNVVIMLLATIVASWMGTTGAALLFIRCAALTHAQTSSANDRFGVDHVQ